VEHALIANASHTAHTTVSDTITIPTTEKTLSNHNS